MSPPLCVTVFFSTHGLASQSVLLKAPGLFGKSTAQCSSSSGASLSLKCGLLLRDAVSVIDTQGLSLCVSSHENDATQGLLKPRHRSRAAPQEIRTRLKLVNKLVCLPNTVQGVGFQGLCLSQLLTAVILPTI